MVTGFYPAHRPQTCEQRLLVWRTERSRMFSGTLDANFIDVRPVKLTESEGTLLTHHGWFAERSI
jgi:hypothetical protein